MMASTSAFSGSQVDMVETFQLLESSDLSVLENAIAQVRDKLGSLTEPWLLNGLVDFYIQSGNSHARDLLCMVRQHQHKILLSKLDDYLQKISTRLKALSLLGHIIRSEPPWTHHIPPSRAFQSLIKCLQIDTDLPTLTSALYILATIMPKVASQMASYLTTICAIFIRLASWRTVKPVGAKDANLISLHAAVYALFLCLYGMYPCHFTKSLQQYFQSGNTKGGLSDSDKLKIFENSIMPMLDQVRLHSRLILDSTAVETSSERWRKSECQDIVADISKVSLDVTENSGLMKLRNISVSDADEPAIKELSFVCSKHEDESRGDSSFGNIKEQDATWSPSDAIGLFTPPSSRALSPTPAAAPSLDHKQLEAKVKSLQSTNQNQEEGKTRDRPQLTLNMTPGDSFVPNRPHETSSSATTPLKQFIPAFFFGNSPSTSQCSTPHKEREKKPSGGKETSWVTPSEPSTILQGVTTREEGIDHVQMKRKPSNSQPDVQESLINTSPPSTANEPSFQVDLDDFVEVKSLEEEEDPSTAAVTSAADVLNLRPGAALPDSPNQLLDAHVRLVAEAYAKYSDKWPVCSSKDAEWQTLDSSPELLFLRSLVVQEHCAMLYERHRREQHAVRARKLIRKVYDVTALEEKNKAMAAQLLERSSEIEDHRIIEKSCRDRLKAQEASFNSKMAELKSEVESLKMKNEDLETSNQLLQRDKMRLSDECELLKTESARLNAAVFSLEERGKMRRNDTEQINVMEAKIKDLQSLLFEAREANCILEGRVVETRETMRAQSVESRLLAEAYKRDYDALKSSSLKEQCQLESARLKLGQSETAIKSKEEIIQKLKQCLEEVKSLARSQIEATEAKYKAQRNISRRLEAQVLELFARLAAIEGEVGVTERTQFNSGPCSIQAIPALKSNAEYDEDFGSLPQLSPPAKGSLMADPSMWTTSAHVTLFDD